MISQQSRCSLQPFAIQIVMIRSSRVISSSSTPFCCPLCVVLSLLAARRRFVCRLQLLFTAATWRRRESRSSAAHSVRVTSLVAASVATRLAGGPSSPSSALLVRVHSSSGLIRQQPARAGATSNNPTNTRAWTGVTSSRRSRHDLAHSSTPLCVDCRRRRFLRPQRPAANHRHHHGGDGGILCQAEATSFTDPDRAADAHRWASQRPPVAAECRCRCWRLQLSSTRDHLRAESQAAASHRREERRCVVRQPERTGSSRSRRSASHAEVVPAKLPSATVGSRRDTECSFDSRWPRRGGHLHLLLACCTVVVPAAVAPAGALHLVDAEAEDHDCFGGGAAATSAPPATDAVDAEVIELGHIVLFVGLFVVGLLHAVELVVLGVARRWWRRRRRRGRLFDAVVGLHVERWRWWSKDADCRKRRGCCDHRSELDCGRLG